MNKEEIRKGIYKELKKHPFGLDCSELAKKIGATHPTDRTQFDKELPKLRKNNADITGFPIEKRKINCLTKYELKAKIHHGFTNKELLNDMYDIECGFLLIKKGVFTNQIGHLSPFSKKYLIDNGLARRGMLDKFSDVEDNNDFLYFWVENGNTHSIEKIDARIKVSPSFHLPLKPREQDCYKCQYHSNYTDISISCDKLLPKEKQMPNDIAYVLIPLRRDNEHLMNDDERDEMMPIVEVKYHGISFKKIIGGEITTDISKGEPYFLIGDD